MIKFHEYFSRLYPLSISEILENHNTERLLMLGKILIAFTRINECVIIYRCRSRCLIKTSKSRAKSKITACNENIQFNLCIWDMWSLPTVLLELWLIIESSNRQRCLRKNTRKWQYVLSFCCILMIGSRDPSQLMIKPISGKAYQYCAIRLLS